MNRSENFHDFLRVALQKDPLKRPPAAKLLKVTLPHVMCDDVVLLLIA